MDIVNLTTQNQTHNSDVTEFKIYPYAVTPLPPIPQWLWIAIPLAVVGVGLAYLALKKK